MTVNQGYLWVNFLARKLFSGAIAPANFNLAMEAVNISFFKLKFGLPEDYQPGQPIPRQSYEVTQKITDDLQFLRKRVFLTKSASTGQFAKPADFYDFSTMRYPQVENPESCSEAVKATWRKIEPVTDEEYNYRLGAALLKPILKKPIVIYVNGGYEVMPAVIDTVYFTYLRKPRTPVRNYIIDANDQDVPDPNNPNIELEWPETTHTDFFIRVAKQLGIYLRDEEFKADMQQIQNQGQ